MNRNAYVELLAKVNAGINALPMSQEDTNSVEPSADDIKEAKTTEQLHAIADTLMCVLESANKRLLRQEASLDVLLELYSVLHAGNVADLAGSDLYRSSDLRQAVATVNEEVAAVKYDTAFHKAAVKALQRWIEVLTIKLNRCYSKIEYIQSQNG